MKTNHLKNMHKKHIVDFILFCTVAIFVACTKSASSSSSSSSSTAPSGTVTSIGAGSFIIKDSSGNAITIDTVSGTTYQYTISSNLSAATIGMYVAAQGSVSNGQLNAVDIAFVPTPPSFVTSSLTEIQTTSTGTIYLGQITAIQSGNITISWNGVSATINAANASTITSTTTSSFQAIAVGDYVEINGPEVNATLYDGHQINIGITPAVVGQYD